MEQMNNRNRPVTIFLIATLLIVLIRTAWVCDDAYITMRTVDNFVHNNGLVYNIGERVQSYTHPLWLLFLSVPYLLTHNAYITLILSSLILSMTVVVLLLKRIAQSQAVAVFGTAAIMLSKAFIDYSSSGLENPLSHLLVILFIGYFLTAELHPRKILILSFIAALGAVNRLDLILVFLPAVILTFMELWTSMHYQRKKVFLTSLAGFLPLIAWLIFALVYYGFFFPNTAYAKLSTGIPINLLYRQGIAYYLSSLTLDPITLLVIIWGLAEAFNSRNRQKVVIAVGITLYLGYIVYIGGDFMNGRFFTVPFLTALILLCRSEKIIDWKTLFIPLGFLLIVGLGSPYPPIFSDSNYGQNRGDIIDQRKVADERAFYYPTTGLLQYCLECKIPNHPWVTDGRAAQSDSTSVEVKKSIGFFGFYAGSENHVIDLFGLVDPLLARLPVGNLYQWRIGHFLRFIPSGYQETLVTGVNQIQDPDLRIFYDKLALITRGEIFDGSRLKAIWKMNTGQYDHFLP